MLRETAKSRILKVTDEVVHWVEAGVIALLAFLSLFALVVLVLETGKLIRSPTLAEAQSLLGGILLIFILLELYAIGVALLQGKNIVNKVFEVGLVSLVRSVIVSDFLHTDIVRLGVFAALIIALGIAWYLSRKAETGFSPGETEVSEQH